MGRVADKLVLKVEQATCAAYAQQAVLEYLNSKLPRSGDVQQAPLCHVDKYAKVQPRLQNYSTEIGVAFNELCAVRPLLRLSRSDLQRIRAINAAPSLQAIYLAVRQAVTEKLELDRDSLANHNLMRAWQAQVVPRLLCNRKTAQRALNSFTSYELISKLCNKERQDSHRWLLVGAACGASVC